MAHHCRVGACGQTGLVAEPIPEAEAFISFKLSEMSSRNEHHEFEEIATRIARKRISANILIATGPVSSGGDQQRDAETYTTRIPEELPHSAGFSASASTKPIVVACTVQRTRLKDKVLADLAGICADGADPVEHVAFFSVHPIAEGVTHKLKETARETFGVSLDIFCGADIATFLAEPDLVWVACHYLDMPAAMVPPVDDDRVPEWYAELLESLRRNRGPAALTPATQGEVSAGLRHATWDSDTNADLPEWLDFMGAFLTHHHRGEDSELVFRACYEMAIARFRGMGESSGVEELVRRAIAYAGGSSHANVLDDAFVLASYWGVMWSTGRTEATTAEIAHALESLRTHGVAMLGNTDPDVYPIRAATLIGALAFSYLIPDWRVSEENFGRPARADISATVGVQLDPSDINITSLPAEAVDVDNAMTYLAQLVDLLPKARAYSARQLAMLFTMFTPALVDHPSFREVCDGLDEAVTRVEGDSALAERCRDRGMALIRAGKLLEGLAELHQAKARWFNGDTLYGAVLTMRFIAKVYDDLGMSYAAKLYASSAAMLALTHGDDDTKEHAPKALLEAARHAQHAGTWADAAGLTEVAVLARAQHLPDPFDFDEHTDLEDLRIGQALEVSAVRQFWPDLETVIREAHWANTSWFQMVEEVIEGAEDSSYLMSEDEFQDQAVEQLTGPLFADLGPERVVDFAALGIRWIFRFANDRTTVLTAEGLCAAFQVFVADIALRHPVLIASTAHIAIDVRADAGHEVDDFTLDDSDAELRGQVTLSADVDQRDEHAASLMSMCFQLVEAVHAGPPAELLETMEPMFVDGLSHKLMMGRSYQDAADLLKAEHYERCAAATRPASSARFEPTAHDALGPSTVPGTNYDLDESLQAIRRRYEFAFMVMRYTYPRLLADEAIRATIVRLRADGWLDWQTLSILANVKWNWRMRDAGIQFGVGDPREASRLAREPETSDSPVIPLEAFDDDEVAFNARVQTATFAKTWGLRGRVEHRDEHAMRDLLVRRFGFGVDDVPHRDILDCLDENGRLLPFVEHEPEPEA